jgi:hypothetical protein
MATENQAALSAAIDEKLPLHLISLRHETRFTGRLLEVGEESLLIELEAGHALASLDMVSVSFSQGSRTYTFLASILDGEDDKVWLALPREIVSADRRMAPRIPVTVPIEVELLGAHPASEPMLVDIALTGMKVSTRVDPGLTVGERIPVVLSFEDNRIEIVAELRHQTGLTLGFFFPETIRRGRLAPPMELATLVDRVRRG